MIKIHSESLHANKTSYKITVVFTKEFINPSHSIFFQLFSPSLISPTVAPTTFWCFMEIVDIEGSTVFHQNISLACATCSTTTKADLSFYFTIFHCRMSTFQPACMLAHALLAFLSLQLPQNDTIPQVASYHTKLHHWWVYCKYSFCLCRSELSSYNNRRLES